MNDTNQLETRMCIICAEDFIPKSRVQKTCASPECEYANKKLNDKTRTSRKLRDKKIPEASFSAPFFKKGCC